ncbi:MAG TPA: sodium-dependent bicarbonate transport family permease [Mycobacterium sp.]|nr:sodium-dependent bicarbonate transport family permease [Mycobacterium sp.]
MLAEFIQNFEHNLFKPLLLFFYLGFLIPILKVEFELPYVIYQGLTLYLLLAIGWHGGEELAAIGASNIGRVAGFMLVGFVTNTAIGFLAYGLLSRMTGLRRVDKAAVAGHYGSDSAGTFATCVAVLASAGIAFDGYLPVMLAVMEMPGCLVALYLVARLRHRGMDEAGNMPDEPGYVKRRVAKAASMVSGAAQLAAVDERAIEDELELSLEKREHPEHGDLVNGGASHVSAGNLAREIVLNPGLYLLFGGIVIGLISGLQGEKVVHDGNLFYVTAFQGVLTLFLLEMGMTAARHLKDLKAAGRGFIAFGLLAPNLFAALGIVVAHGYAELTHTHLELGSYVLFAVITGAASYIAVPAVQRMAIPEASPTLPLAASLGLTFAYNVTIGIPLYLGVVRLVTTHFPVG